jgi:hypothetical protein
MPYQLGNGHIADIALKAGESHISFFSGTGAGTVNTPATVIAIGLYIKNTDASATLTVTVATGDSITLVAGESYTGKFRDGITSITLTGTATYKGEWMI